MCRTNWASGRFILKRQTHSLDALPILLPPYGKIHSMARVTHRYQEVQRRTWC